LHSALEALINFAYNGRIQIDTTNVQLLLVGSSFLHLQVVKDACCDFMRNRCVSSVNTSLCWLTLCAVNDEVYNILMHKCQSSPVFDVHIWSRGYCVL